MKNEGFTPQIMGYKPLKMKVVGSHGTYLDVEGSWDQWLGSVGCNLPINRVYWGVRSYNPLILTFDPNFLGHCHNVGANHFHTIHGTIAYLPT